MNIFKKFYLYLHYWSAVNIASRSYRKYHRRFFVIPGTNGDLLVCDRKNFRGLRAKHWVKNANGLNMKQVADKSFYYTPYADGTGYITATEKKQRLHDYYNWYVRSRLEYKAQKKAKKAAAKEKKVKSRKDRRDARKK